MEKKDIERFYNCAKHIEKTEARLIRWKQVKWYVSSDENWVIDDLRKNTTVNTSSIQFVKVIANEGVIKNIAEDTGGYERAILDVELLARCDRLIITGGSTFGMTASLRSQRKPFVIESSSISTGECAMLELGRPTLRPGNFALYK